MIRPFALMVTAAAMIVSFLLIWDSPPESFLRQSGGQTEQMPVADSYLRDAHARAFSTSGAKQFSIIAEQIDFFSDMEDLFIVKPIISSHENRSDQLLISASIGVLDRVKNQFTLSGDVRLEAYQQPQTTVLRTDQLSYFVDTGLIASDASFDLTSSQMKIRGKGLTADPANHLYTFKEQVKAIYEGL